MSRLLQLCTVLVDFRQTTSYFQERALDVVHIYRAAILDPDSFNYSDKIFSGPIELIHFLTSSWTLSSSNLRSSILRNAARKLFSNPLKHP